MNLAFVGNGARTKPAALVAAVGLPAVAAVGAGGLSVGFFLWYALALNRPHGGLFLDGTLALALVTGVAATYAAWLGYGRYFSRRTHVSEVTAMQYDAISWSALVLLWGTLLPPSGPRSTSATLAPRSRAVRAAA